MRDLVVALLLAVVPAAPQPRASATQGEASPVGTWHTIDDATGKPRGIVEIVETNGVLTGVIRGSLIPGEPERLCDRCPGDRRGKPIIGLEIVRDVRRDGDNWGGGEILDPDNGRTYRVKLTPSADGRTMQVRGFLGISLLGRTQVWRRAP